MLLLLFVLGCSNEDKDSDDSSSGGVAVTSVSLYPNSETIFIGNSTTLTTNISPTNATNKEASCSSSDTTVATAVVVKSKITSYHNCYVTGVAEGTATIKVVTKDGNKVSKATVTVQKEIPVTGISFKQTSSYANPIEVAQGSSTQLTVEISPANATNQRVSWAFIYPTSQPYHPTITPLNFDYNTNTMNAKITVTSVAIPQGIFTIKVTTEDGNETAVAFIKALVPVASVSISPQNKTLYKGDTVTLAANVFPHNASDKTITWTSSNSNVATVSGSGKVTAIATGIASATAWTSNALVSKAAIITVLTPDDIVDVIPSQYNMTSAIKFPTKTDDSAYATIDHKFTMAQTEVTYELWEKVYDWATGGTCNSATGENCYVFANAGAKGGIYDGSKFSANSTGTDKQPVTNISWRDSIVWCNAYTEWYNATTGSSLTVAYKNSSNAVLRDSTKAVENLVGTALDAVTTTGFRLPTVNEWEFTARLRKTEINDTSYPVNIAGVKYYFTKGNSACGARRDYTVATETSRVAWYNKNSCDYGSSCSYNANYVSRRSKTRDVATKPFTVFGIYDMSGNVSEWCFDKASSGTNRIYRGGSWYEDSSYLQIGKTSNGSADYKSHSLGLRVARSR